MSGVSADAPTALVTGGSRGIGAAVVSLLAADGWWVHDLDRDPCPDAPDGVIRHRCDVADETEVVRAVRSARDATGPIGMAVLNAGTGGSSPVATMSVAEWDRVHGLNARGTFLCLREVARTMLHDGVGGAVVAVTSISARQSERTMAHYASSKAAVEALVRTAAVELGPSGIRVNAVAPGTTDTPMFTQTDGLPGYRDRVACRAALGRVGSAEEVARAVVAVAGLEWVTGQVLAADGGLSRWSPIDPLEGTGRR